MREWQNTREKEKRCNAALLEEDIDKILERSAVVMHDGDSMTTEKTRKELQAQEDSAKLFCAFG